MTNEEIQKHIEQNCRNAHGEPMMDEQAFYEGAKWMRDQALRIHDVVGRSEQLKAFLTWLEKEGYNCDFEWDETTIEDYIKSL